MSRRSLPPLPAGELARVRDRLAGGDPSPARLAEAIVAGWRPLGVDGVLAAVGPARDWLLGAGPLQPLVDDPATTDVLVNGPQEVWVDQGHGLRRLDVELGGEPGLRELAVRLAGSGGRRLDDASPCVDARLPDGVRLHAVLPPVSPAGTLLSLRVPRRQAFTLGQLAAGGAVPPSWVAVLERLVRRRVAFLVSGSTGSGKTTVLSTLLGLADPGERVVLVEDASELRPALPHVVRLEARHGNVEGAGAVTQQELVRHALRMRPDRIVVGECRGPEVRDLLSALNTGHEGGCGTVHANAAADVPARLEALGALAGLDPPTLAVQAASALQVLVHLRRDGARRRLVEIATLHREAAALVVEPALTADPQDPGARGRLGPGWPRLQELLGLDAPP